MQSPAVSTIRWTGHWMCVARVASASAVVFFLSMIGSRPAVPRAGADGTAVSRFDALRSSRTRRASP
jgi:hypothetical protein